MKNTKTYQRQNVRRLISALRSGEYPQGAKGKLRSTTGFCCQGVGCDLYDSARWGKFYPFNNRFSYDFHTGDFSFASWRDIGTDHYGIHEFDGDTLALMNDGASSEGWYTLGERCTFEEIADCLEYMLLSDLVGEPYEGEVK